MKDIREELKKGPFIFDGAIGTYISGKTKNAGTLPEIFNISDPDLVGSVCEEYAQAGAMALTSNTFALNRRSFKTEQELSQCLEAGWQIASKAAEKYDIFAFADIGPVYGTDSEVEEEYIWLSDRFISLGAKCFIFESQSSTMGLKGACANIKKQVPDAFIIISFAVGAEGFSTEGHFAEELLDHIRDCRDADAVGFNCGTSASHIDELLGRLNGKGLLDGLTVSVMPNAGYPQVIGTRTFYEGDPYYYAVRIAQLAEKGAAIIGGCCGTTPVHIAQIKKLLDEKKSESSEKNRKLSVNGPGPERAKYSDHESEFWRKLSSGLKVTAVELDPPADIDLDRFIAGAKELNENGADIITIADCPIGRARMDSSLLACKVRRELGIEALPHMTCRDRNINATKALMMGLYAENIRNILLVTGDPVPTAQRDEVKSVYQFNSRKLARFARSLNEHLFPSPVHFFGALNINARNFDMQIKLAKEKEEEGITGFLTQPVMTQAGFENLKKAREELKGYILGGIIPVISERNARFMDAEINGISVDPKIMEMYAGKDRDEAEELAREICGEIARRIAPYTDGYYFMTPFMRTGLISRIISDLS